jgi:hypothetical protein
MGKKAPFRQAQGPEPVEGQKAQKRRDSNVTFFAFFVFFRGYSIPEFYSHKRTQRAQKIIGERSVGS